MNSDREHADTPVAAERKAPGDAADTARTAAAGASFASRLRAMRESGRTHRLGPAVLPASISAPFIRRPVATALLTIALALAGIVAFGLLPVAPLPQVDFPVVVVRAKLPGAGPETMAATVATPLERSLGRIAGVSEMTSTSSLSNT